MGFFQSFKQGFYNGKYGIEPETFPSPKAQCLYDYCCKIVDETIQDKDYNQYYENDLNRVDLNQLIDLNTMLPSNVVHKLRAYIYKTAFECIKKEQNIDNEL